MTAPLLHLPPELSSSGIIPVQYATSHPIRDLTTEFEYEQILQTLPPELGEIIAPNIRDLDEIIIDKGRPLAARAGDLRIQYPYRISDLIFEKADTQIQNAVKLGWREDGRIGIPSTLHRLSREINLAGLSIMITIRIGRALYGVAEPLRDILNYAVTHRQGIAIIGPPAAGKTTLLRDIARIMSERMGEGLMIIDTSNEIAGDSDIPHRIIHKARRVPVGDPKLQAAKFARSVANGGPQGLLSDEVGYRDDIPIILQNAPRGVSVTATLHGRDLARVLRSENLWPLLGIKDGHKYEPSVFPIGIEVLRRGHFRVHQNFDKSIEVLLSGGTPTEGVREILPAL